MSMLADEWPAVLEGTHALIRDYSRVEFEDLGRKVIYRLQRIEASGIYGDDYNYKTLWGEYCHEVQNGPVELLAGAWHVTILPLLDDVVERIPRHAALLLSIAAAWELDEDDAGSIGAYWPDGIREVLRGRITEDAGRRNLYQFGR